MPSPDTEISDKEEESQNISFLVNKSGFPLDKDSWNLMLDKIKSTHPKGERILSLLNQREQEFLHKRTGNEDTSICENEEERYDPPGVLSEPKFLPTMSELQKIAAIQRYLNRLQYNHTGMQFFNIKKNRSINRLYETAKDMIRFSLPIKCLEAVVLSLYLTASLRNVSRFTIRFKTKFGQNTHKHIVLGIYHSSRYGALGLSRRTTLMDKPITFLTLTELILEYKKCYEECYHTISKVKMSSFLSSDKHSNDNIVWNNFTVNVNKLTEQEMRQVIEKYAREMKKKTGSIL